MGEPEDGVEDPDEWSSDLDRGQLGADTLECSDVAACFATDRGNEAHCDSDPLVDRGSSWKADTHHLRNELIQNRYEPWPLEMQQLGGASQSDPGVDTRSYCVGQQSVAADRNPFSIVGLDEIEVRRNRAQPPLLTCEHWIPQAVLAPRSHCRVHRDDVLDHDAVWITEAGQCVIPAQLRARVRDEECSGEREAVEKKLLPIFATYV